MSLSKVQAVRTAGRSNSADALSRQHFVLLRLFFKIAAGLSEWLRVGTRVPPASKTAHGVTHVVTVALLGSSGRLRMKFVDIRYLFSLVPIDFSVTDVSVESYQKQKAGLHVQPFAYLISPL